MALFFFGEKLGLPLARLLPLDLCFVASNLLLSVIETQGSQLARLGKKRRTIIVPRDPNPVEGPKNIPRDP